MPQHKIVEEVVEEQDMHTEDIVSWAEAKAKDNNFLNTEDLRKRTTLVVTNLRIVKVMGKKYKSEEVVEQLQLRGDVLTMNDKKVELKIGTNSLRFITAIGDELAKLKLADEKVREGIFSFSIKKIGENTGVNYDIENFAQVNK